MGSDGWFPPVNPTGEEYEKGQDGVEHPSYITQMRCKVSHRARPRPLGRARYAHLARGTGGKSLRTDIAMSRAHALIEFYAHLLKNLQQESILYSVAVWRIEMREICISTEVFAQIWSRRKDGEESEDEILRRLLADIGEKSPNSLDEISDHYLDQKEITSMQSVSVRKSSRFDVDAHSAWWEVVYSALKKLGGEASLHYIYKEVELLCKSVGKKLPRDIGATVRGTLEDNCAQSDRYKAIRDVFGMPYGKGKGIWNLK